MGAVQICVTELRIPNHRFGNIVTESINEKVLKWLVDSGNLTTSQSRRFGLQLAGGPDCISETPVFTLGLPWVEPSVNRDWIGTRLIWWPNGVPEFRRVSIVSSRLGRRLDLQRRWFDLLRTCVLRLDAETEGVVAVESTAAAAFVLRTAELFGVPALRIQPPHDAAAPTLQAWIHLCLPAVDSTFAAPSHDDDADHNSACRSFVAVVSPELPEFELPPAAENTGQGRHPGDTAMDAMETLPVADRLLFAAANRVVVIGGRPGGVVEQLVQRHVEDKRRNGVPVVISAEDHRLLNRLEKDKHPNAIRWVVQASGSRSSTDDQCASGDHSSTVTTSAMKDGPLQSPSSWLCHWTRAQGGPWPDQTQQDWLDELILACDSADRSALAALFRIVQNGTVLASSDGIRGTTAVVSLTAVPLSEFRVRRVYRRHRQRFDFEPFGIAVRRSVVQAAGAQPVIYGDEDKWSTLDAGDRFRFQPTRSGSDDSPGARTEWSAEEEWRFPGTLKLSVFDASDVCVFAATERAAESLRQHGRWRVVVVR
jgi:hypothetical protein